MQRYSKNRNAILECLNSTKSHPTAEWIYEQIKPDYPKLSLGTVYRNLCQMKAEGIIRSMGVVAGEEHFDGDTSPHMHIMCSGCGRIVDMPIDAEMRTAIRAAESATWFRHLTPQFTGSCPDCENVQARMTAEANVTPSSIQ